MNRKIYLLSFTLFLGISFNAFAKTVTDTIPLRDRGGDYLRDSVTNPFNLRDPNVIEKSVEYDPATNKYYITEKVGSEYYRTPTVLTFDEYMRWKGKQQERDYFERLAGLNKKRNGELIDPLSKIDFSATQNSKLKLLIKSIGTNGKLPEVPKIGLKNMGDNLIGMIFGDPPTVDIRPQGQIDLTLGGDYRYFGNPVLPTYARTNGGLLFNMDIQMNVTGKIGEKLNLNTAFNNKATFDFDNIMKINYNSNVFSEDDIIKSIEGGNVSLPLRGSLIQGSQNLFGIKTELQFGNLRLTALVAQQRNRRQNLQVSGGSQFQNFNIAIDQYDENRHFFLSHFNRNTFEKALEQLPLVNSQFSITKMEVWVSNERNEDKEVRPIIAFADLGENEDLVNPVNILPTPGAPKDITGKYILPTNVANDLYQKLQNNATDVRRIDRVVNKLESTTFGLTQGRDFVKRSAKRLQPTEYSYNPKLGTISINNVERQQVVGVSFIYFYNGQGPFQVGEFAENIPTVAGADSISQVVFVKMLKNTIADPSIPLFDLMMKNVYSVGAYITNPQDLQLDILYQDPGQSDPNGNNNKADKRSLSELKSVPLLSLLNLDRLNQVGDPQPDGQFDFINEVTINTRNGRIMFPVLEPFGSSLKKTLDTLTGNPSVSAKYVYQELYDSTLFRAQESQEKNRFFIRGRVKSTSSNRIQLNAFGLRPGAVTVTAGAYALLEGVDYAIDYGTSTLTILNAAYVAPNIPLNISYEDNALFGIQARNMLGLRADYQLKKNFNIGATYINLSEQPFTRKVNYGDDPINNSVYGLDVNFTEDAPWLTKLVDKIPFIDTKEPSKVTFSAEGAMLRPGHSDAINVGNDVGGSVFVDDFEGSSSPFSLTAQPNSWALASVPQRHPLWKESVDTTILTGVNRASLNWYRIDQFVREKSADRDDIYVSPVLQTEVFPNKTVGAQSLQVGGFTLPTFDVAYQPRLRGPYNFDIPQRTPYSAGLNGGGGLNKPETRWAGIMRGMTTTDFEAANIEYMDFWVLDPLLKNGTNPGTLIFHLGDISEDILKDSRKMFENGLPSTNNPNLRTDKSIWGRVPRTEIPLPNSFSADENERRQQDVGLDGLNDEQERVFYADYLTKISGINPAAFDDIKKDPSNDDFKYYNDYADQTTIAQRYLKFNGVEGNSASNSGNASVQTSTNIPDAEDVNRDNSFDENEGYYEYKIPVKPNASGTGMDTKNLDYYIESLSSPVGRTWHHFRIPIDGGTKFGQINGFRSIRYMRMIVKDFADDATFRFAKFDLIRNQWRRYKQPLETDVPFPGVIDVSAIELNAVSIEENSKKLPFNYVLPPGVLRENIPNSLAANAVQNEQSLSLKLTCLPPKDRRAAFKLFNMDMRVYQRMKMFVHAESVSEGKSMDKKTKIFMRVGSDFIRNYYEYEIPLTMSDPSVPVPPSDLTGNSAATEEYKKAVWLAENTFDFPLSLFTNVKTERNNKRLGLDKPYETFDPEKPLNKVRIVGNPDIGLVKGVMVGVFNNDLSCHDLELWVNELRVTGLNENSGGAAIARADFKLADFGNVSVSGSYLGIGYGAIDQRVAQRSREEVKEIGITGNFELGKFFPVNSGLRLPLTVQYSNNVRTPEFDPYDLDLKLKDKVNQELDGQKRDSIQRNAETAQTIKGFSLTNVRKDRVGNSRKPMPWDIENFSASYGYTQLERRDPLVQSDSKESYKGGLDYTYSHEPLYIAPFKKVVKNEKVGKYLKLLTEFNFNPIPNTFSFNTVLDRQLNVTQYRFAGDEDAYNTFYQRRFTWDRNYNLQWDLTRSLKLNFDAKNNGILDEALDYTIVNRIPIPTPDAEKSKTLKESLGNFGRTKRYDQNVNVNYTVPTKNIPFMDWVNIRATYGASYGWEANARDLQAEIGNYVNNKQNRQLNADLNFDNLYAYSKYLRKIQATRNIQPKEKRKKGDKEDPSVKMPETKIPEIPLAATDTLQGKKKKKREGEYEPSLVERILVRPLLTLRKARLNYQESYNSYLPGFLPEARTFGMADFSAPGWDYIFGWQQTDDDWLENARRRNWISSSYRQTRPVLNNYNQTADARLTLEPFQDFRVEMDISKNYTKNTSQEFRNPSLTTNLDSIRSLNRYDEGAYTISYFTLNTFFTNVKEVFQKFSDNREKISTLLNPTGADHPEYPRTGYKVGFGPTSQDVLIPAFIAAYSGQDVTQVNKNIFKQNPALNWRLTYNGLAKLGGLKEIFSNISITHAYKSTLTVNSFRSEPFYQPNTAKAESKYEYYPQYNIPTLVITESFSPLLGIDVSLKSGVTFGINYKKSRNLALSVSNTQLRENNTSEFTVKFGHRLKNVYIKFLDFNPPKLLPKRKDEEVEPPPPVAANGKKGKTKKEAKPKKGNDLVLSFDLALRDDYSVNHLLGQGTEIPANGNKTIRVAPSATYTVNKTLDLRFYIDYNSIVPYTTASFPSITTTGGFVITYKLN